MFVNNLAGVVWSGVEPTTQLAVLEPDADSLEVELATMPSAPEELRRDKFVNYYLGECNENAMQSAIKAGYSKRSAGTIGHELLKRPEIRRKIAHSRMLLMQEQGIHATRIIQQYAAIAFANIGDYMDERGQIILDPKRLSRAQLSAIDAIQVEQADDTLIVHGDEPREIPLLKIRIKLHDKLKALEALAKYFQIEGIGTNKVQLTGEDGAPLVPPALHVHFE